MPLLRIKRRTHKRLKKWTLESNTCSIRWGTLIFFRICFPWPIRPYWFPMHLPFVPSRPHPSPIKCIIVYNSILFKLLPTSQLSFRTTLRGKLYVPISEPGKAPLKEAEAACPSQGRQLWSRTGPRLLQAPPPACWPFGPVPVLPYPLQQGRAHVVWTTILNIILIICLATSWVFFPPNI